MRSSHTVFPAKEDLAVIKREKGKKRKKKGEKKERKGAKTGCWSDRGYTRARVCVRTVFI